MTPSSSRSSPSGLEKGTSCARRYSGLPREQEQAAQVRRHRREERTETDRHPQRMRERLRGGVRALATAQMNLFV